MKMPAMRDKPVRRQQRVRSEHLGAVRHTIHRATGLRADLDKLDDGELADLYALVEEIRNGGDEPEVQRTSPSYLDAAKRARWEKLVAKACGLPDKHFAEQRRLTAEAEQAERVARTPKPHQTPWEAGATVLPAILRDGLTESNWTVTHLLVATLVLMAVENRAPLHRRMRVEHGTVIVAVPEELVAPLDPYADVQASARALRELSLGDILTVERVNGETRIRLGDVLADAIGAAS